MGDPAPCAVKGFIEEGVGMQIQALIEVELYVPFLEAYGLYSPKHQGFGFQPLFQADSHFFHVARLCPASLKARKQGAIGAVPLTREGEGSEEGDVDPFGLFKIARLFQEIQEGEGSVHRPQSVGGRGPYANFVNIENAQHTSNSMKFWKCGHKKVH